MPRIFMRPIALAVFLLLATAIPISFIMLPIYLITGEPVEGYAADLLFVLSWGINLSIAEWVIRRRKFRKPQTPMPLTIGNIA